MGLPQDIVARAERYPKMLARRDEAMARLQSEREVAEEEAQRLPDVEPLVRNRNFWIAVGVGVALCSRRRSQKGSSSRRPSSSRMISTTRLGATVIRR